MNTDWLKCLTVTINRAQHIDMGCWLPWYWRRQQPMHIDHIPSKEATFR